MLRADQGGSNCGLHRVQGGVWKQGAKGTRGPLVHTPREPPHCPESVSLGVSPPVPRCLPRGWRPCDSCPLQDLVNSVSVHGTEQSRVSEPGEMIQTLPLVFR